MENNFRHWFQLVENATLTQSRAFRAWFADSKIVDKAGQPLKLYRGLRGDYIQTADRMEARPGYSMFFSTSPHVAATYGNPDDYGTPGAIYPVYVKAATLKEFPTKTNRAGYREFDKFEFDRVAIRLPSGTGLVAREVSDMGPHTNLTADPKRLYSYASDIYAFGRGTSIKSAVSNSGTFDSENPAMTETR